jgi:drug/metabolite transporter (DMT)-like permease
VARRVAAPPLRARPAGAAHRAWVTGALAVLFVLCWSSGFIGAKLGAGEAPMATVLLWRFVPLALLVLPILVARGARGVRGRPRREIGVHVVVGLLSQSGYLLTVYGAIGLGVSTGATALVDGLQPLVAAAVVGPLLGVVVTRGQWAGLVLGLVGVVAVCWADATSGTATAPAWAYLVPLVGMLSFVASTIVERRSGVATPPLPALAIHLCTSVVAFAVLAVATGGVTPPASASFWLATAWLVVLPTFGGYGLYWVLVARIGVTRVSSLLFLMAPVTAAWGALVYGEPLTAVTVAGLALATFAAVVVGRPARAR